MVAKIKIGRSIQNGFYYNENKVRQGVASLLMAENYPVNQERLQDHQKLHVLQKINGLRPNLKANSIHISLNFDPSEKLSEDMLRDIAAAYMEKIGFGEQPYLVYQHFDSGHPHLHIVSTKVKYDGGVVDTNYIALKKSEPARKAIELEFNLVKAQEQHTKLERGKGVKNAYAAKVIYGKTETKKAIANVLTAVIKDYKYTSLHELNAVLKLYNVWADRGKETSATYQHHGLLYHILDDNGMPVGVPIKASSFSGKPTLKNLERIFETNKTRRMADKSRLTNAIDRVLLRKNCSIQELTDILNTQGVAIALRKNESGQLYGLTYIDHRSKTVFNGSALGKQYSAKGIEERCSASVSPEPNLLSHSVQSKNIGLQNRSDNATATKTSSKEQETASNISETKNLLDVLIEPEKNTDYVTYPFRKKKKKKQNNNTQKL